LSCRGKVRSAAAPQKRTEAALQAAPLHSLSGMQAQQHHMYAMQCLCMHSKGATRPHASIPTPAPQWALALVADSEDRGIICVVRTTPRSCEQDKDQNRTHRWDVVVEQARGMQDDPVASQAHHKVHAVCQPACIVHRSRLCNMPG